MKIQLCMCLHMKCMEQVLFSVLRFNDHFSFFKIYIFLFYVYVFYLHACIYAM